MEEDEILYEEINKRIQKTRKEIKRNTEEYNSFRQTPHIQSGLFEFYRNYLLAKVEQGIEELKQLTEQNND